MVSHRGAGLDAAWASLAAAEPAGRQWHPDDGPDRFLAAPVPEDYRPNPGIPRNLVHFLDRGALIALDAALQAVESAGLGAGAGDSRRFAVCDGLPYRAPGQPALFVPYGHAIARALGTRGPVVTVGGHEASGMAAIAEATRLVATGAADVVVTGAGQALQLPLCEHVRGQAFATRTAARPFDASADGFVLAEGAAYLVIESEAHLAERGGTPIASIAGVGELFDSATEPLNLSDATEAGRVMQAALSDAGYLQNQVDLLISCADGRPAVDYADGLGALRTFGRHAYYAGITTIAGSLGFALAASGPLSVAIALEAMRRGEVFPVAGLERPAQGLESPEQGLALNFIRESKAEKLDCILVTSMGIGGTNLSLVLSR